MTKGGAGRGGDGRGTGRAIRPLAEQRAYLRPSDREIEALARRLRTLGVESVAVGFLHSYLDPEHELRVGRALEAHGLPVTLSHRLSREYREYERWQTAIANAYLQPLAGRYLSGLEAGLRPARLTILQSDGTTATDRAAAREPVRTVLSGPAGGALAALDLARREGDARVLSFDMGGTSTDVALIDAELPRTYLGRIAGVPLRTPMIDVTTVGAGGGSIARRDAAGALRVGPESAGADPGPACYGRGESPTVTDAHLVLGRLGERDLLGGGFPVSAARAMDAIDGLARSAGMKRERAAEGILEVVEATMERALRAISLGRGRDPRAYVLYAFGGAGGLHACRLAERLGITRVVIPRDPGVFSATGLASAAPGVETALTLLAAPSERARLRKALRSLERAAFGRLAEQGIGRRGVRLARYADLRYAGQSHEITVRYGASMQRDFARAHLERYGYVREASAVEVVTLRVRAGPVVPRRRGGAMELVATGAPPSAGGDLPAVDRPLSRASGRKGRASVFVGGRWIASRVLERGAIGPRTCLRGPARVTEYSATTFVPPGWVLRAGRAGTLLLTPGGRA